MRLFLTSVFMAVVLILTIPRVVAGELPPLNQIIIDGQNGNLEMELQKGGHSKEELGMALVAAAGVNNVSAAKLLIAAGASVEFAFLSVTPLITAVTEHHEQAVQLLLESDANPNVVGRFDWKPLHFAIVANYANPQIVKLLIEHGAMVDSRTSLSVTPLHRAASFCKLEIVKLLLQFGANKLLTDKYGDTAELRAKKSRCIDVVALLRQ